MSATGLPLPIVLHRAWWRGLLDRLRRPQADPAAGIAPREGADDQRFEGLSAATLHDIGAPPWLQARQQALHDIERARDRALLYR